MISVDQVGEQALRKHRDAIQAARTAGAARLFYTDPMGARMNSPFAPANDQALTKASAADIGVPFTALRHGFYAESCPPMMGREIEAGKIRVPEEGR